MVQRFAEDRDPDAILNVGADIRKINFCFKLLKEMYIKQLNKPSTLIESQPANITIVDSSHYDSKEMKDLKETLKQRDNEIGILVNMLKNEKKKGFELR